MPRPEPKKVVARRARVGVILPILKREYPDAKCSLDHGSPLELLVATILSAQCTDDRVNIVTKTLFKKYRSAADYAQVPQEDLEKDIQSTGFYRNKAKSVRAMAQALLDHHGGQVPQTMDELTPLAGVGRKTANVVLGNAFGKNVGVTVDTHVTRLSNRLGLTDHVSDAVKIEQDLAKVVPQADWALWSHLLIYHGRKVCQARTPLCETCVLLPHCPAGPKFLKERATKATAKWATVRVLKKPRA
jgi:endonuclease-3